jgi:hypothetical protein
MKIQILRSANYNINVKPKKKLKVSSRSGIIMARKLADLQDVDISGVKDTFVLMYDEIDEKFKAYDPDRVLSKSLNGGGPPQDFMDYLENNLTTEALLTAIGDIENRINLLTLGDLSNVDDTGVLDKYVVMYNQLLSKYVTVNPDEVLKASVEESTQPGLPEEFLDQLDTDLDNRIDFDGGEY